MWGRGEVPTPVSGSCEVEQERLSRGAVRAPVGLHRCAQTSLSWVSEEHVAMSVHVYVAPKRMLGNNLLVLSGGWFLPAAAGTRGRAFSLARHSSRPREQQGLRLVKDGSFRFCDCSCMSVPLVIG